MNESGRRIGETHHNARISDELVDLMRSRHEEDGLGYRKISREFLVALTTVRKICTYERRAQSAERWKSIKARKPQLSQVVDVRLTMPVNTPIQSTIREDTNPLHEELREQATARFCAHFCGSE